MKIKSGKRNIKVNKIAVPPPKKENEPQKKQIKSFFGASTSKSEPKTETITSTSTSKSKEIKQEKISPRKESPKKNQSKSHKQTQGKSSIATFFSSKPTANGTKASSSDKAISQATIDIEKVEIKDEPVVSPVLNSSKSSLKRSHLNTSGETFS